MAVSEGGTKRPGGGDKGRETGGVNTTEVEEAEDDREDAEVEELAEEGIGEED